ncbi:MAG: hypothetical protein O7G87_04805 [bacterium]|nr:hypothetical protein [bacterium]
MTGPFLMVGKVGNQHADKHKRATDQLPLVQELIQNRPAGQGGKYGSPDEGGQQKQCVGFVGGFVHNQNAASYRATRSASVHGRGLVV